MIKDTIENNENVTVNQKQVNILKENFPACFDKDGKFDIYKLEYLIKENKVDVTKEGYDLNFLGKSYAKLLTALETETVIKPDLQHNCEGINKNSENIYITADNLDALKHLLKSYEGKIKCIYIDPPYNTGSDGFVYMDNFKFTPEQLAEKAGILEEEAQRVLNMTSKGSASHSAWLTFMYPRLYLSRDLLSDDGVIFISIDDNEQSDLKLLCDEIFGEENFVSTLVWQNKTGAGAKSKGFIGLHEYILCYAKIITPEWDLTAPLADKTKAMYNKRDEHFEKLGPFATWPLDTTSMDDRANLRYPIFHEGNEIWPRKQWLWSRKRVELAQKENKLVFNYIEKEDRWSVRFKGYLYDEAGEVKLGKPTSIFIGPYTQEGTKNFENFFNRDIFPFPKPVNLIKELLSISVDTNLKSEGYFLDFFSGAATTAQAVMELNAEDGGTRKYIMVQLPEECKKESEAFRSGFKTINQIGIERIKRAANKIKEETDKDIDYGFKIYQLVTPREETIDKMLKFNPKMIIDEKSILDEYGLDTVLDTWKIQDGYGFNTEIEELVFYGYTIYQCKNTIYMINSGITTQAIKALIEKYQNDSGFSPNRIVLFGYSFGFTQLNELKHNLKGLPDYRKIDIFTRY